MQLSVRSEMGRAGARALSEYDWLVRRFFLCGSFPFFPFDFRGRVACACAYLRYDIVHLVIFATWKWIRSQTSTCVPFMLQHAFCGQNNAQVNENESGREHLFASTGSVATERAPQRGSESQIKPKWYSALIRHLSATYATHVVAQTKSYKSHVERLFNEIHFIVCDIRHWMETETVLWPPMGNEILRKKKKKSIARHIALASPRNSLQPGSNPCTNESKSRSDRRN